MREVVQELSVHWSIWSNKIDSIWSFAQTRATVALLVPLGRGTMVDEEVTSQLASQPQRSATELSKCERQLFVFGVLRKERRVRLPPRVGILLPRGYVEDIAVLSAECSTVRRLILQCRFPLGVFNHCKRTRCRSGRALPMASILPSTVSAVWQ